jgi:cell division transport system permease protein
VQSVTPDAHPTSFTVTPTAAKADIIRALQGQFKEKPGVRDVVAATDTIRTMERLSGGLSLGLLVAASALSIAALVLIANTIQTAMFARRREIEVMKLVGATNWFIRIPFMLEGLVQGLLGAAAGVGVVSFVRWIFDRFIGDAQGLELLRNFVIEPGDLFAISAAMVVGGALIGAIASAIAVTFYLDV